VAGSGSITAAHAESLVVTQQVIKEAMRLYPPVPIMSRQALADVEVEGHAVRAGTSMLIPIYAVHRHEKRWDDAHSFRPERFSPENEPAIPRYQYMPFGAGPRVCIGRAVRDAGSHRDAGDLPARGELRGRGQGAGPGRAGHARAEGRVEPQGALAGVRIIAP
jgi:hypothetical protein